MANADETVAAVSPKLPPFWTDTPEGWFSYIESNFNIAHITRSRTKFDHVVTALPSTIIRDIIDVIQSPNADDPYAHIKKTILARTTISERERLRQLLSKEDLGDRTPSQLLRHMQALLGNKAESFDATLFRELFIQRLPATVQRVVAAAAPETSLSSIATMADSVMEIDNSTVSSIKTSSHQERDSLGKQIAELSQQLASLSARVDRLGSQNSSHRSRSRNRSKSPHPSGLCYYHRRFKNNAKKCVQPCNFTGNAKSEC